MTSFNPLTQENNTRLRDLLSKLPNLTVAGFPEDLETFTLFPHRNVCSSQSYVSREQCRLCSGSAQARFTFGSGLLRSAQVCLPLLRDAAQLRITLLEIINL
jgi:hypothetical protein